jgi:hypothetical protein
VFSQDVHTLDLEGYIKADVNITSFRLVDPGMPKVQQIVDQWKNLVLYGFPNRTFGRDYFVDETASRRNRNRQTTTPTTESIPSLPNDMLKVATIL